MGESNATTHLRQGPCPCGSGRRYKSCCLGRDRARAELRAAAHAAHARIDSVLDQLITLTESRGERKIACAAGCNACCHQYVRCTWAEALCIAAYLLQPEQAALLAKFEALLPSRTAQLASELIPLDDLLRRHRGIPRDAAERQTFWQVVDGYNRRWQLCPFNDERGLCGIYPVRPLPCRVTYVVDGAENCGPKAIASPVRIQHPALEQAIQEARELLLAAADRAGRPAEKELVGMVGDALTALRTANSPA